VRTECSPSVCSVSNLLWGWQHVEMRSCDLCPHSSFAFTGLARCGTDPPWDGGTLPSCAGFECWVLPCACVEAFALLWLRGPLVLVPSGLVRRPSMPEETKKEGALKWCALAAAREADLVHAPRSSMRTRATAAKVALYMSWRRCGGTSSRLSCSPRVALQRNVSASRIEAPLYPTRTVHKMHLAPMSKKRMVSTVANRHFRSAVPWGKKMVVPLVLPYTWPT